MIMSKRNYDIMESALGNALHDLAILAGDAPQSQWLDQPGYTKWTDVAGTAAANLRVVAELLDDERRRGGFRPTFPSVWEVVVPTDWPPEED